LKFWQLAKWFAAAPDKAHRAIQALSSVTRMPSFRARAWEAATEEAGGITPAGSFAQVPPAGAFYGLGPPPNRGGEPQNVRHDWPLVDKKPAPQQVDLRALASKIRRDLPANVAHRGMKVTQHQNETPRGHYEMSRMSGVHSVTVAPNSRVDYCKDIVRRMKAREKREMKKMDLESNMHVITSKDMELMIRRSKAEAIFEMMASIEEARIPAYLAQVVHRWKRNMEKQNASKEGACQEDVFYPTPKKLLDLEEEVRSEATTNMQHLTALNTRLQKMQPGLKKHAVALMLDDTTREALKRRDETLKVLERENTKWELEKEKHKAERAMSRMSLEEKEKYLWDIAAKKEQEAIERAEIAETFSDKDSKNMWWAVSDQRAAEVASSKAGNAALAVTIARMGSEGSTGGAKILGNLDGDALIAAMSEMTNESLANQLGKMSDEEIQEALSSMSDKDIARAMRLMDIDDKLKLMKNMSKDMKLQILQAMSAVERAEILMAMSSHDRMELLNKFTAKVAAKTLLAMNLQDRVQCLLEMKLGRRVNVMLHFRAAAKAECILAFPKEDPAYVAEVEGCEVDASQTPSTGADVDTHSDATVTADVASTKETTTTNMNAVDSEDTTDVGIEPTIATQTDEELAAAAAAKSKAEAMEHGPAKDSALAAAAGLEAAFINYQATRDAKASQLREDASQAKNADACAAKVAEDEAMSAKQASDAAAAVEMARAKVNEMESGPEKDAAIASVQELESAFVDYKAAQDATAAQLKIEAAKAKVQTMEDGPEKDAALAAIVELESLAEELAMAAATAGATAAAIRQAKVTATDATKRADEATAAVRKATADAAAMKDGPDKDSALAAVIQLKRNADDLAAVARKAYTALRTTGPGYEGPKWHSESPALKTLGKFKPSVRADTVVEMQDDKIVALVSLVAKARAKTLSDIMEGLWIEVIMGMNATDRTETTCAMSVEQRVTWLMMLDVQPRAIELATLDMKDRVKTLAGFDEISAMVSTLQAMMPKEMLVTLYAMSAKVRAKVLLNVEIEKRMSMLIAMPVKIRAGSIIEFTKLEQKSEVMRLLLQESRLEVLSVLSSHNCAEMLLPMEPSLQLACILGLKVNLRAKAFDQMNPTFRLQCVLSIPSDKIMERAKTVLELVQTKKKKHQTEVLVGMLPCPVWDPKVTTVPDRVQTIMAMSKSDRVSIMAAMDEVRRNETLQAMDPKDAKALLRAIQASGLLGDVGGESALALLRIASMSPQDAAAFLLAMSPKERYPVMSDMLSKTLGATFATMSAEDECMCLLELREATRARTMQAMIDKMRVVAFHILNPKQRVETLLPEQVMSETNRTFNLEAMSDEDLAETLLAMSPADRAQCIALVSDDACARAMSSLGDSPENLLLLMADMPESRKNRVNKMMKGFKLQKARIKEMPRPPKLPGSGKGHPSKTWQEEINKEKQEDEDNKAAMIVHKATLMGISVEDYKMQMAAAEKAGKEMP